MKNKNMQDTRSKIIASAAELFRNRGYNQVGIQDILDASGVSRGSFYFWFKSKEKLGEAVSDYFGRAFSSLARDAFSTPKWADGVDAMLQKFFGAAKPATPVANLGIEFAHGNRRLLLHVARGMKNVENAFETALAAQGLPPESAFVRAGTMMALIEGHALRMILSRDRTVISQLRDDLIQLARREPDAWERDLAGLLRRKVKNTSRKASSRAAQKILDSVDDRSIISDREKKCRGSCETDSKRRFIVSRAARLFWERGYYTTSVSSISAECGVAKGSFHFYFDNKSALVSRVLEHYKCMYAGFLKQAATVKDLPEFIDMLYELLTPLAPDFACPIGSIGLEVANTDVALAGTVGSHLALLEDGCAAMMADKGLPSARAARVAATVIAVWEGQVTRMVIHRDSRILDHLKYDLLDLVR